VRISDLDDDSNTLQDAAATWLTGHTERITFGDPYIQGGMLQTDATIHVPCKYLERNGDGGQVRCTAHRFEGKIHHSGNTNTRKRLQLGDERFSIIHKRKRRTLLLPPEEAPARSLPVLEEDNPCATAQCRTSDNVRGAACCRDLSLEIHLPKSQVRMEALLRSRKAPYLCKVKREDEDTMECEVISACGYLEDGTLNCVLHGRVRPNGKAAKPSICSEWPDLEEDEGGHPGCVLVEEDE
jgi:hypothetical protein